MFQSFIHVYYTDVSDLNTWLEVSMNYILYLSSINLAVVVAQLVERSLPTPEIRGSNPNFGKLYLPIVNRKDKNKEKEAGNGPI